MSELIWLQLWSTDFIENTQQGPWKSFYLSVLFSCLGPICHMLFPWWRVCWGVSRKSWDVCNTNHLEHLPWFTALTHTHQFRAANRGASVARAFISFKPGSFSSPHSLFTNIHFLIHYLYLSSLSRLHPGQVTSALQVIKIHSDKHFGVFLGRVVL